MYVVKAFKEHDRIGLSLLLGCAGLLLTFILTAQAWLPGRLFPLTPVIPGLASLPDIILPILFTVMVAGLCVSFFKAHKAILATICVCLAVFILQDMERFQPYIYMYGFILICGLSALHNPDQERRKEHALNALRAMVIGIYFWAGVQKINFTFYTHTLPWFLSPILPPEVIADHALLVYFVLSAPFLEILIALCFLHPKTVRIGLIFATSMLILVLLCLGPLGHNWNQSVWPWNIALYTLDILLFRKANYKTRDILLPSGLLHSAAIALFICLPVLSYWGKWHAYPSFQLYSGNIQEAYVEVPDNVTFTEPLLQSLVKDRKIWLVDWAEAEINMVVYPEDPVFKNAGRALCAYTNPENTQDLKLVIRGRPDWWTGKYETKESYPCRQGL